MNVEPPATRQSLRIFLLLGGARACAAEPAASAVISRASTAEKSGVKPPQSKPV